MMSATRTVLGCLVLSGSVAAGAAQPSPDELARVFGTAPAKVQTDIKPQRLADALTAWAQQFGYQIIVPESPAAETLTTDVRGTLTAEEALNRLLEGKRFYYEVINARTIAVKEETIGGMAAWPTPPASFSSIDLLLSEDAVTVTGSRVPYNLEDLRASITAIPVTVIDREQIDALGLSTLPEVLQRLPQVPYVTLQSSQPNAAQVVNLRGLETIVLLNGRRIGPSANSLSFNAFDLGTLPLAAVERIEVLASSASAVYGADAIGGVINVILREDIPRPIVDVQYGSASGGAGERRISAVAGNSNDRLRTALVLSYADKGQLLGEKRERYRNQNFTPWGGQDHRSPTTNPASVIGESAESNPAPVSLYRYWSVSPALEKFDALGSLHLALSDQLLTFGEIMYDQRHVRVRYEPTSVTNLRVPASNPFNPFGADMRVNYLFAEAGPTEFNATSELRRAVAGVRYNIVPGSDFELSVAESYDAGESWTENVIDRQRARAAALSSNPDEALDVFSGANRPELIASLISKPNIRDYEARSTQIAAILRTSVRTTPTGDVRLVLGAEWSDPEVLHEESTYFVTSRRGTAAAFAEARIPLVNPHMNVPFIAEFSATIAARYDEYSDFGSAFSPQYGIAWRLSNDVNIRAAYSKSFRAPTLLELHSPRTTIAGVQVPDYQRNGEIAVVDFIVGGNLDLRATTADSLSAGFVYEPQWLPPLELSATYWSIDVDDRISILPYADLVTHPDLFPGRVIRDPATPNDGTPGRLRSVDISRVNYGSLSTSGIDLAGSYSFDTAFGRLASEVTATWVHSYSRVNAPNQMPDERVGKATALGTIPRWRAKATVTWERNAASMSATAHYTQGYSDADPLGNYVDRRIGNICLVDVAGSYDVSKNTRVSFGVANAFNTMPDYSLLGHAAGYDLTQGNLIGRYWHLKVAKEF